MKHGEWVCSTPRCCGKSGWMTEDMMKRGEVLLMTWEEIKPVAEAILGDGCGGMTLEELWEAAKKRGYSTIADFIAVIEAAGAAYKWLKAEYPGRKSEYRECLTRYARMINRNVKTE